MVVVALAVKLTDGLTDPDAELFHRGPDLLIRGAQKSTKNEGHKSRPKTRGTKSRPKTRGTKVDL